MADHQEDATEYLRVLHRYQNRFPNSNVEEPPDDDFLTCFDQVSADNRVVQSFTMRMEYILQVSEGSHPNPNQFWLTLNMWSIRGNNARATVNPNDAANAEMELGDAVDRINQFYISFLPKLPIPYTYQTKSAIEWSMCCRNLQIPHAKCQQLLHILTSATNSDGDRRGLSSCSTDFTD